MKKDNLDRVSVYGRLLANILLLDEIFVISRIIKVEVGDISKSLITLTETLIIMDISNTESNNCFIIH